MIAELERETLFPPISEDTVLLGQAETPIGAFRAAITTRGLACLSFPSDAQDSCAAWAHVHVTQARVMVEHPALVALSAQLTAYFEGTLREFSLPLDLHGTPFQMEVWNALLEIPYGEVRSYATIANVIRRPRAVRAVGMANHANPVPIIVPCHRVIGSDLTLTGYGGGLELKERLLRLEGVLPCRWPHLFPPASSASG